MNPLLNLTSLCVAFPNIKLCDLNFSMPEWFNPAHFHWTCDVHMLTCQCVMTWWKVSLMLPIYKLQGLA